MNIERKRILQHITRYISQTFFLILDPYAGDTLALAESAGELQAH